MTTSPVDSLFRDLEQGARALTATRRLARQLSQRYADWKTEQGARAWPTPYVRAYEDWLLELWQSAFAHAPDAPRLLSDDQESLLWERVIRRRSAAGDPRHLLRMASTARTAGQAWRRVHEWRLDPERLRAGGGVDTSAFVRWAADLENTLRQNHWLGPAQLPGYLLDHHDAWPDLGPEPVWWAGFDMLTPEQERLRARLSERGIPLREHANAGIENADVTVMACADPNDQWRHIARWARRELEENPRCSLGVVCPDLQSRREEIEEIFEDVLHPESSWRVDAPRAFHLSLGRPLSEYPLVESALDLLRMSRRPVPFEVISRTLHSIYIAGGSSETAARVDFELELRRRREESLTLTRLAGLAERAGLEGFKRLLASAGDAAFPDQADPAAWAEYFSDWLRAFGWPGERTLDSREFQLMNAWREQLAHFAALRAVESEWTPHEALKKLTSMVSARILQFHDEQAPVQIVGARDASGLWFDKLWLADMNDTVWPPAPRPDPFIPVSLQKERGMPEASAEAVLAHTRRRTDNLLTSAGWIRVSYVPRDGDVPAGPSPVFRDFPEAGESPGDVYPGRIRQLVRSRPAMEHVDDHQAPPVRGTEQPGGVGLVADQARCPFRALAHHRLRARELRDVTAGLSESERGTVVHKAVRFLWQELEKQETLNAMSAEESRTLVARSVEQVFRGWRADSAFRKRFLDIEWERLTELLLEWLAYEKGRGGFRVVGTEVASRLELDDAVLDIRVDRIDELDDGRLMIVDYKTGRLAGIHAWTDPRMEEPQLPMYALSVEGEVAALAFAGISRGKCELRGVGDDVDSERSLKPVGELGFESMDELKSWWRRVLVALVAAHRRGEAAVDPRTAQTCRTCDAMSLCRIFERGLPG